jgi:hypothetical protein
MPRKSRPTFTCNCAHIGEFQKDKVGGMKAESPETVTDREDRARKPLDKLMKEGLGPKRPDKVVVIQLPDFIESNGRHHKMVRATWNYGRRISGTEFMIFGYFRQNKIIADREGHVFGFEGREVEYRDYCKAGKHTYET